MHRLQIILSALVIAACNLVSMILGFWAYKLGGGDNQIAMQLPVLILTGVALVAAWVALGSRWSGLHSGADMMAAYLLCLPAGALLFTGAHFLTTGYLTSASNLSAMAALQICQNLVALPLGAAWRERRSVRPSP
jgi:hypothetical protein